MNLMVQISPIFTNDALYNRTTVCFSLGVIICRLIFFVLTQAVSDIYRYVKSYFVFLGIVINLGFSLVLSKGNRYFLIYYFIGFLCHVYRSISLPKHFDI